MVHHWSTGSHHDQEEGTEELGEESPPLLARILEVADSLEDGVLVADQWLQDLIILR